MCKSASVKDLGVESDVSTFFDPLSFLELSTESGLARVLLCHESDVILRCEGPFATRRHSKFAILIGQMPYVQLVPKITVLFQYKPLRTSLSSLLLET